MTRKIEGRDGGSSISLILNLWPLCRNVRWRHGGAGEDGQVAADTGVGCLGKVVPELHTNGGVQACAVHVQVVGNEVE